MQPHAQSLFHFQKFLCIVLCACEHLCIHLFRWEERQQNFFVFRLPLFTVDQYCFSTSFYWSLEQSSSLCHISESLCFVLQVFPSLLLRSRYVFSWSLTFSPKLVHFFFPFSCLLCIFLLRSFCLFLLYLYFFSFFLAVFFLLYRVS